MKYFGLLIIREAKKLLKTILFSRFNYFSFLFCASLISLSQRSDSTINKTWVGLEKRIDSVISNAINHEAFPGCVVYAARQDSVFFHKSYGYHTYDSITEVKKEDVYDLASITKVVGGTLALMKLYDDELIRLDDPIREYVRGIKGKVGKVTIREALAHQGGLYPWIPYHQVIRKSDGTFRQKDFRETYAESHEFKVAEGLFLANEFYEKRVKKLISKSDVQKNPSYKYSGLFFYLIPEIVERLTGMDYESYLQKTFYEPLEAGTMGFNPLNRIPIDRIPPTEVDTFFRMSPIHGQVHDEGAIMMRGISGNAGLFSNAGDLGRVMNFLLCEGQVDSLRLLSKQSIALFTTAQYPNKGNRRGLGFDKPLINYDSLVSSVAKDASFKSYGHSGYTGTLAWADPASNLIFIFLSNRVYPTRANRSLYRLNVRPTIHQLLYDYLQSNSWSID